MNFFIPIALSILLALIQSGKIPASAVKGLLKLRDALNLAFPSGTTPAAHIQITEQ
jgi:hypothetical protein